MIDRASFGVRLRHLLAITIVFLATPVAAQFAGAFTFVGPSGMGAKIKTLVFHPTDPNIGWFGAVGGGVYKTTNGGASWFAVGDGMTNMAVTTLAVDPTNPNILYAGTGDTNYTVFRIGAVPGNGIHKSTDGGLTWTHLTSTNTSEFEFTWEIALNPAQPSHLYVATNDGVFRSLNSGASFTRVFGSHLGGTDCRDVAVKPGSAAADVVLAGCLNASSNVSAILHNPDAGGAGAWVTVHTESNQGRANLVFAPSSPATAYALVSQLGSSVDQTQVPMLVLLKSTNSGATWSDVARQDGNAALMKNHLLSEVFLANQSTCIGIPGISFILGEGNDKNALAVDPVNANRLYAGGKDFYRSTDGGVTWGIASNSKFAANGANMRTGQYAIAFPAGYNGTSSQTMWIAGDIGLYKTDSSVSAVTSTDPCTASSSFGFVSRNTGIGAMMLEDGAPQTGGTTYFGASRRFGVIKGTDAGGPTAWTSSDTVVANEVLADLANPMVVYRRKDSTNMQKSVDGGTTWSNASTGISGIAGFNAGSAIDPSSNARLWTGAQTEIYRSTDSAASWQTAAAAPGIAWTLTNIAVAPSDPNRVVAVGFDDFTRTWLRTTTSGLTSTGSTGWTERFTGVFNLRRHAIAIDPLDPQVLLLGGDPSFDGVIRSPDFGATWDTFGNGLIAAAPVTALLIDPAVPGRVFAGTEEGLWSTADGGLSWSEEPGIPRTYISRLRLVGRNLFAFTLGRGAWRAVLDTCTLAAPTGFTANATSTSAVSLSWNAVGGATEYEIYRSSGDGPFNFVKSVAATATTDVGLSANTTYVYKVRAVCGAFSAREIATTIVFANDPLNAGTAIQAIHITQLRAAIDAVRAASGLSAESYTHSITADSIIRRTDITEMRDSLADARFELGLTAISLTDATITAGTTAAKAVHIIELRNGVQ